jgi:hypothetical protein
MSEDCAAIIAINANVGAKQKTPKMRTGGRVAAGHTRLTTEGMRRCCSGGGIEYADSVGVFPRLGSGANIVM